MAIQDVKITDLDPIPSLRDKDLFLVAHPLFNSDGSIIANNRYTSNSLSGGALRNTVENWELSVQNHWYFNGGPDNIPSQTTKLEIDDLISALEDDSKLTSIVDDTNQNGWYYKLSSSVLQKENDGVTQSLSVRNDSIPNIDFVQRAIAKSYKSLLNQLTTIISQNGSSQFIPSHVGEIVITTRFSHADNTINDTNIRKFYGYGQKINGVQYPNTQWIQHSGYLLSGASSGVSSGSGHNNKDGGALTERVSVHLPNHRHYFEKSHNHSIGGVSVKVGWKEYNSWGSGGTKYSFPGPTGSGSIDGDANTKSASVAGNTTLSGSADVSTTISTLPPVKRVYIWERIS